MADPISGNDEFLTDFDRFYRRYYGQLRNYISYKTGDIDVAKDLAQECFVKVWENKHKVRVNAAASYLYSVANNLTMNHFRHAKVVFKFFEQRPKPEHHETPHFLMEEKEFDTRLQNALSRLSDKQRIVFLMNRIDDLTYVEIADRIGISTKAVEKRMHGALDKLRELVKQKI